MGKGDASPSDYFNISLIVFCPVIIVILACFGYAVAKIVMGSIYLHECSIEKMIPVYLIVSALSPVLLIGFFRKDDSGHAGTICGLFGFLFNLAWLISGSVWIYPNYGKLVAVDFKRCSGNITAGCLVDVCNKSVITFALATLTIDWFFFLFWICFIIYLFGKLCGKY